MLQNVLIREGIVVAKIYEEPAARARLGAADSIVPIQNAERIRLVEFRFGPSDEVLIDVGNVVVVGQVIARADIFEKLEELRAKSQADLERLDQQYANACLELEGIRAELDARSEEKNRVVEELIRFSAEPLFAADLVRLRKSLEALENDAAESHQKIEDLQREIAQLEEKRSESKDREAREKARVEQEAAMQASFSGKVLRIDRQPEGEKIRLSVLYQQGAE